MDKFVQFGSFIILFISQVQGKNTSYISLLLASLMFPFSGKWLLFHQFYMIYSC